MRAVAVVVLCFTAASAHAERVLLDGVAAVVGRRVITRTEVETEGRMVLVNRAGAKGLAQPIDDSFRKSVLDYLVVQELLVQEARRVHGLAISEAEVDRGVAAFKARFDDAEQYAAFLKETGADEEAVRTIVRRDLTVRALMARIMGPEPDLSEEDVRRYLKAHPQLLAKEAPEVRRQAAREALAKEAREARFSAYVDELKKRTEVRIVADYGPSPKGGGARSGLVL